MKTQVTMLARRGGLYAAIFLAGALVMGLTQGAFSQNGGGTIQTPNNPPDPNSKLLRKDLWFYLTTDTPNWHGDPDIGKKHMAHQAEMEKKGIFFGAGPVSDPSGKHEYGLIIFRAKDAADAKRIADSDPMHISGARTYTLHHWSMNEGTIDVRLFYSDGTYQLN